MTDIQYLKNKYSNKINKTDIDNFYDEFMFFNNNLYYFHVKITKIAKINISEYQKVYFERTIDFLKFIKTYKNYSKKHAMLI